MERARLIHSLLTLQREGRTGVLNANVEGARTAIYAQRGVLVYATTSAQQEPLGRRLVQLAIINEDAHAKIRAKLMAAGPIIDENLRFADVAVSLGFISDVQMKQLLIEQVRRRILRVLGTTSKQLEWSFQEASGGMIAFIDYVARFPVTTEALVLEAMRAMDDAPKRQSLARILDTPLLLTAALADTRTRFALTMQEATFLKPLIMSGATPRELLASPEASAVDGYAVLGALGLARGIRERAASDTTAATSSTTAQRATVPEAFRPVSVSGPASGSTNPSGPPSSGRLSLLVPTMGTSTSTNPPASQSRLATAANAPIAKTPPPPPSSSRIPLATRPSSSGMQSMSGVDRVSSIPGERVSTVPNFAGSKPPGAPTNPNANAVVGNQAFETGLEHAKNARWSQAAADLARAVTLMPRLEKYRVCSRWATIQARIDEPLTKAERAELTRLAVGVIKADPDGCAFAYYIAGTLALLEDDVLQAHKLLSRAVKLDPTHLDAGRQLRVVERRTNEPQQGAGLKKKLW